MTLIKSGHFLLHSDGSCSFEVYDERGHPTQFYAETWAKAARMCGAMLEQSAAVPEQVYAPGVDDRISQLERRIGEVERRVSVVRSWGS